MARKPASPTPRSVSATLRAADFRSSIRPHERKRSEGFLVGRNDKRTVWVRFVTDDPDLREVALAKMSATLSHKGWLVTDATSIGVGLLVRET
jgi:hypothetical protein